jgi:hypothetical protein
MARRSLSLSTTTVLHSLIDRPLWQTIEPILNLKNGIQKVLLLATILVQVFIDQSYSLTLQGPIVRTTSPSPDNRAYNPPRTLDRPPWQTVEPILNLKIGFEKALPLATILVHVFIVQSYSLILQGPIRPKSPSPEGLQSPLDWLLGRFWIWKRFSEGIAIGYNTGTGSSFGKVMSLAMILVQIYIDRSYSLTLQLGIRTKSPPLIIGIS